MVFHGRTLRQEAKRFYRWCCCPRCWLWHASSIQALVISSSETFFSINSSSNPSDQFSGSFSSSNEWHHKLHNKWTSGFCEFISIKGPFFERVPDCWCCKKKRRRNFMTQILVLQSLKKKTTTKIFITWIKFR